MTFSNDDFSITTPRLLLRPVVVEDANQTYVNWLNDPEVNRYLETKSATIESIRSYIAEQRSHDDILFLGIFLKDDGRFIGTMKFEEIDLKKHSAASTILIGDKTMWGKGYGTEAIRGLIRYGFDSMGIKKINLGVITEHRGAIRAYEKVGFFQTAAGKVMRPEETVDKILMAVTPETFLKETK